MASTQYQACLEVAQTVIRNHQYNADDSLEHSVTVTIQVAHTPPSQYEKRSQTKTTLTVTHTEHCERES